MEDIHMTQMLCKDEERILFFDNIRYLMVLLVVVLHIACGYSNYTTWWAVNDDNSAFCDFILRLLGVFLMPTLFFIAGYFALQSLHRKGTWLFIKSKMIRLGIPWLIGVVLLGPVRTYIYEYS
jgi:fucose 4-O-acetylase-like acetyltransferase